MAWSIISDDSHSVNAFAYSLLASAIFRRGNLSMTQLRKQNKELEQSLQEAQDLNSKHLAVIEQIISYFVIAL